MESLDFVLAEACSRPGVQKPQLVLAGATLPSEAQLQSYTHKVLCSACPPTAAMVQGSAVPCNSHACVHLTPGMPRMGEHIYRACRATREGNSRDTQPNAVRKLQTVRLHGVTGELWQLSHLALAPVQCLDAENSVRTAGLCEGRSHAAGGAAGEGAYRPPAQVRALLRQRSCSLRCACAVTGPGKGCQGMQYMACSCFMQYWYLC